MRSEFGIGRDWPFDCDELEPHYTEAEYQVGVNRADDTDYSERGDEGAYPPRSRPFPVPPEVKSPTRCSVSRHARRRERSTRRHTVTLTRIVHLLERTAESSPASSDRFPVLRRAGYDRVMTAELRIVHTSVEDYLAGERRSGTRHEYVDGELFAMVGASRAHNALVVELTKRLALHLDDGPCRLAASDMKVRAAQATRYYYPDLVVSCNDPAEEPDEYVETHPTLVIEVLSDSTAATDRREKRLAYQATESLQEYVMVRQDRPEITVYRRDAPDWVMHRFGEGERVTFASLDYAFTIDELYRKIP